MKRSFKFIILIFLVFGFGKNLSAQQCNYNINNGTQCVVTVTVDYYPISSCTTVCNSLVQVCPPGATTFNCGGCSSLCNIVVTIGGYSPVDNGSNFSTSLLNQPAPCSTSGCGSNNVDINWTNQSTDITCAP